MGRKKNRRNENESLGTIDVIDSPTENIEEYAEIDVEEPSTETASVVEDDAKPEEVAEEVREVTMDELEIVPVEEVEDEAPLAAPEPVTEPEQVMTGPEEEEDIPTITPKLKKGYRLVFAVNPSPLKKTTICKKLDSLDIPYEIVVDRNEEKCVSLAYANRTDLLKQKNRAYHKGIDAEVEEV